MTQEQELRIRALANQAFGGGPRPFKPHHVEVLVADAVDAGRRNAQLTIAVLEAFVEGDAGADA